MAQGLCVHAHSFHAVLDGLDRIGAVDSVVLHLIGSTSVTRTSSSSPSGVLALALISPSVRFSACACLFSV